MTPGGVIRTCWRREAYGRNHYKESFLSFRMFPRALAASEADSVSGQAFFKGSSIFCLPGIYSACVYRCVYWRPPCRRFNPIMLNSGLKALPLCRKCGQSTISSLQVCHVKEAKQGSFFFPSLPHPLYFLSICLFCLPCLCLPLLPSHSLTSKHTHTHTLRANPESQVFFESLPEGKELLAHLLPALF